MASLIFKSLKPTKADKHYNKKELKMGIAREMEHTTNRETAEKIAKHHLDENENYYTDLKNKMPEEKMKGVCPSCNEPEDKCVCSSVHKSILKEEALNLLKAKRVEVGGTSARKDGSTWKKVSEGKWEKLKEGSSKEIKQTQKDVSAGKKEGEPKKGSEEKGTENKPQPDVSGKVPTPEAAPLVERIDKLLPEQKKVIGEMITSNKGAEEINNQLEKFEAENNKPESKQQKTNDLINKVATKKLIAVMAKMKDLLATTIGGTNQELVDETGKTGEVVSQNMNDEAEKKKKEIENKEKEIKKSFDSVFNLLKAKTTKYYKKTGSGKTAKYYYKKEDWDKAQSKKKDKEDAKEKTEEIDKKISKKVEDVIRRVTEGMTTSQAIVKAQSFLSAFQKEPLGKDSIKVWKEVNGISKVKHFQDYMSKIIPSKNEREEGGKKLTLISPDKKTEEKKEENLFKKEGPKIVYKNVDVSDLSSIFNEGILSMDDSENNNWEDGKRAENRTDVVYTFSPKGNENSFTNYGVALLEIEQEEKKKNKFESDDVQAENYDEYISEGISPDKIKKVYLPKIFKGKLEPRLKEDVKNKVEWVDIKAKHWDSEKGEIVDAPQIVMNQFANTASFEDSSELNYFRGKYDNGDVFDLKNIEYVIEKETRGEDKQKRKERRDKGNKRGSNFDKKAEEIDNGIGMQEPPTEKANRMEFFNENPDTAANIGEDVLGAKRHNFDTYSVEQLEREGLAHKVINKKFLYGDINSEAETKIENGETFEKIAVVYAIKKTLKAKVEDDESKRALFVDLSRIIEEANTATEQADTFLENTRIKMGFARARDWSFEASKKNREAANKWEETVGKRTMSILLGKKRIKSSIRDKQELINELRKFGYKKEDDIKVKKGDLVKVKNFNSDKFKKGFKSPKALYENREEIGIMVRRLNGERDRDKWREMYKEYNKLTGLEKYSPVEEEHKVTKVSKGKYHVVMKYKIPGRTGENIQRVEYSVPIEDLELISSNKSERKKKAEPKIILEGKVERVGGKKVSEDRLKNQKVLKDNFGMRGLQYGNSMTNEEIDYHTQRTVEAFLDMGEVIGLPAEDLSMKGRLAMAYGARGSGGAIAHYEPSQKIINLTRGNGFGSLAHEWFHFVDNVISNVDLDKKGGGMVTEGDFKVVKSKVFSSESLKHGDIINVRGLRTYVYNKDGYNKYYALGVNAMEPSEWKLKTGTDMNIPESTFSSGMISTEKNEDSVGQKASEIATFLEKKMEEPLSQYSNYWKRRREIMARAFESYVADKLEDKKQKNTYLTSVSKTGSSDVYPQGETRKEANKMFDELFRMMGEQGTLKKAFDFYFNSAKNTTRTIEDANKKSPNSKLIFKSGK